MKTLSFHFRKPLIIVVYLYVFSIQILNAQPKDSTGQKLPRSIYAGIAFGQSSENLLSRIDLSFEINNRRLLMLGFNATSPVGIFGPKPGDVSGHSYFLGYGKIIKSNAVLLTFAGGPALLKRIRYDSDSNTSCFLGCSGLEKETSSTGGVHAEVQVIPSWRFIGLDLGVFINLGFKHSFGGATLGLALGQVNYKKPPKDY